MELFSLLAKLTLDSKEFDQEIDNAKRSAESLDDITTSLEIDNSDFDKGLADSENLGTSFKENIGSTFGELKSIITASGVALAIGGIVNSIKEAVNLTAQTADGIDKGSKRLNISTKNYQAWNHALEQSGASITDLQKGILLMNTYLNGEKSDEMTEAFKKLKINVDEAGTSTENLVEKTLMALAGFEGTKDERGLLVTTLFGKGGTNLNAFLDEGEQGVKKLLGEADQLGLIMGDDEIKNAVAYGDAVANLNKEIQAIKTAFVADIIPVLKDATEWLTSLLQTFNPRARENALVETFKQIDKETLSSIESLTEKEAKAQAIIDKLAEMGDYWTLDDNGKKTFDTLADELIKLYPELDKVINTNKKAIADNKDEILKNIDAWTKLEKQRLLDQNVADKRTAVAEKYAKALDKEIEAELKEAEATAKQQTAIDKMNEALSDPKNADMREAFFSQTGFDTVTAENFTKAAELFGSFQYQSYGVKGKVDEWRSLNEQAESLRKKSEEMTKEADNAQVSLTEYSEKLAEKIGLTDKDVKQAEDDVTALNKALLGLPEEVNTRVSITPDWVVGAAPKAIGDAYIPYDNYPALLHRGEKVLTARQARQESSNVDLSGLEDRIIAAIQKGMENAQVNSYLDGDDITDRVSRNLANQLADRRYV